MTAFIVKTLSARKETLYQSLIEERGEVGCVAKHVKIRYRAFFYTSVDKWIMVAGLDLKKQRIAVIKME